MVSDLHVARLDHHHHHHPFSRLVHPLLSGTSCRLDAAADTPGWRDAHGTRSKRPPQASLPAIPAATAPGTNPPTSQGHSDESRSQAGSAVFPGEWSAVERAVRAATAALIEAEPVSAIFRGLGWIICGWYGCRGEERVLDASGGGLEEKEGR